MINNNTLLSTLSFPGVGATETPALAARQVADPNRSPNAGVHRSIVYIDSQILMRDCFAQWLADRLPDFKILPVSTALEVSEAPPSAEAVCLVVYNIRNRRIPGEDFTSELSLLRGVLQDVPVVVISDVEDVDHMIAALEQGVRGYIPTSLDLAVAGEAIRFVHAGGTFVPASALLGLPRSQTGALRSSVRDMAELSVDGFTPRQIQVLSCLWQGKQNKMIAYELMMSESTVKVHIRHIMKKLRASNRTEVVFLTRQRLERAASAEHSSRA